MQSAWRRNLPARGICSILFLNFKNPLKTKLHFAIHSLQCFILNYIKLKLLSYSCVIINDTRAKPNDELRSRSKILSKCSSRQLQNRVAEITYLKRDQKAVSEFIIAIKAKGKQWALFSSFQQLWWLNFMSIDWQSLHLRLNLHSNSFSAARKSFGMYSSADKNSVSQSEPLESRFQLLEEKLQAICMCKKLKQFWLYK